MDKLDPRPRCQETISYYGGEYLCDLRYGHLGVHTSHRIFTGMLISPLENGQDTMEPICNAEWPNSWNSDFGERPHCTLKDGHRGSHSAGKYGWRRDQLQTDTGPSEVVKPIPFPEVKPFDGLLTSASMCNAEWPYPNTHMSEHVRCTLEKGHDGKHQMGERYSWDKVNPLTPSDYQNAHKVFQFDESTLKESLDTKIGVAIGAASLAWNDFRTGTFDSTYAATIVEALQAEIEKEIGALNPDPEKDGRVTAFRELAHHPIFEECLDYEIPLIDAMIKRLNSLLEPTEGETEDTSEDVTTTKASLPHGYSRREAVEIAIRIAAPGTPAEVLIADAKKIEDHLSGDDEKAELAQRNAELRGKVAALEAANRLLETSVQNYQESAGRNDRDLFRQGWHAAVDSLDESHWGGSEFVQRSDTFLDKALGVRFGS